MLQTDGLCNSKSQAGPVTDELQTVSNKETFRRQQDK